MDHDDPIAPARGVLIGLVMMAVVAAVSVLCYIHGGAAWEYAQAHPYHWPRGWGW